jgi:hypothetical protein
MQHQTIFDISINININININTPVAYRLLPLPSHTHAQTRTLAIAAALAPELCKVLPPLTHALASRSTTGTPSPHERAARLARQPCREPAHICTHACRDAAAIIDYRRCIVTQRLAV